MALLEVNQLIKTLAVRQPCRRLPQVESRPVVLSVLTVGKTTFFNLLTGVYEPTEGTVTLSTADGVKTQTAWHLIRLTN